MFGLLGLLLATIAIGLFVYGILRGRAYDAYVAPLDSADYPLKGFYIAGFSLNQIKLFQLRGKLAMELKRQAMVLYGEVYYEYYANLAWAQFLSLALLSLSVFCTLSALVDSSVALMFLMVAALAVATVWNLSMSKMKETLEKRREDCVLEFPDMIAKLSLLINSGMVLREAWKLTAYGKDGELYQLMRKTCEFMENGESDISAIYKFGVLSDTPEIKKFSSAIIQGLEKGNSGLVDFLSTQARELWEHKRQIILQKGEIAAGKLAVPLGIMFAGVIMIIMSAAMQGMSF